MKRFVLLLTFAALLGACNSNSTTEEAAGNQTTDVSHSTPMTRNSDATTIEWMTIEDAVAANAKMPKKFFIDVYTDWCGWCKVMDKQTFTNPDVIAYMNAHFYPVKFNAEQKENVTVNGQVFEFMPNAGRRGVHTLAYSLLQGRMSYPSVVYMNEQMQLIRVSPGYKKPEQLLPELQYAAEEQYLSSK